MIVHNVHHGNLLPSLLPVLTSHSLLTYSYFYQALHSPTPVITGFFAFDRMHCSLLIRVTFMGIDIIHAVLTK